MYYLHYLSPITKLEAGVVLLDEMASAFKPIVSSYLALASLRCYTTQSSQITPVRERVL